MSFIRLDGVGGTVAIDERELVQNHRAVSAYLSVIAGVISLGCFQACALSSEPLPRSPIAGRYHLESDCAGFTRTALVCIPSAYESDRKLPLVLVLHGAGGSPVQILTREGWDAKAESAGFIAVAPAGLPVRPRLTARFRTNPAVWNSGQLKPASPRTRVDDVAFIRLLLEQLSGKLSYDTEQVFATGHSNGGSMCYRLAAEMPDRLTAIATVAGQVAVNSGKRITAVPTLSIYGTLDPMMPLNGGESQLPWGSRTTEPVAVYLSRWAIAMNCESMPRLVSDDYGVQRVEYRSKAGGPTLNAVAIEGHGHRWPGGRTLLPETLVGPASSQFNATDEIWRYFQHIHRNRQQGRGSIQ